MEFFDSVNPGLIPEGSHACLYADGRYKATAAQAARFAAVRWITVYGGGAAAKYAGCADFEQGNPVFSIPGALRAWVQGRNNMHCRARVYSSRGNLAAARNALAGLTYEVWLATLDGNKLSAEYTENLWGVQYAGGLTAEYDTSILYGEW